MLKRAKRTEPTEQDLEFAAKFASWQLQARLSKGWNMAELARRTGYSNSQIRLYDGEAEAGIDTTQRYRTPQREYVESVATATGANLREGLEAAQLVIAEEVGELTRVLDSQEREVVKYLRGMPPEIRDNFVEGIRLWSNAGERLRATRTERSTGKAADREENPTLLDDSEAGRAVTQAALKARKQREEDDAIFAEANANAMDEYNAEAAVEMAIAASQAQRDQKKARR